MQFELERSENVTAAQEWQSQRVDRKTGSHILPIHAGDLWNPRHWPRLIASTNDNKKITPLQFTLMSTQKVDEIIESAYRNLQLGELDANILTRWKLLGEPVVERLKGVFDYLQKKCPVGEPLINRLQESNALIGIPSKNSFKNCRDHAIWISTNCFFFLNPPYITFKISRMVAGISNILIIPNILFSESSLQTAFMKDYHLNIGLENLRIEECPIDFSNLFRNDGRLKYTQNLLHVLAPFVQNVLYRSPVTWSNLSLSSVSELNSYAEVKQLVLYVRVSTNKQQQNLIPITRQIFSLVHATKSLGLQPIQISTIIEIASSHELPAVSRVAIRQLAHIASKVASNEILVLTVNPDRLTRRFYEIKSFSKRFRWLSSGLGNDTSSFVDIAEYQDKASAQVALGEDMASQHGLYSRYYLMYCRILFAVQSPQHNIAIKTTGDVVGICRTSPHFSGASSSSLKTQRALLKSFFSDSIDIQTIEQESAWSGETRKIILSRGFSHHCYAAKKNRNKLLGLFWPPSVVNVALKAGIRADEIVYYNEGVANQNYLKEMLDIPKINPPLYPIYIQEQRGALLDGIEHCIREASNFIEGFQTSSYQGTSGPLPLELQVPEKVASTRGMQKKHKKKFEQYIEANFPESLQNIYYFDSRTCKAHCYCTIAHTYHDSEVCVCSCIYCSTQREDACKCSDLCTCPPYCPCTCKICHVEKLVEPVKEVNS
ncbi:hypothetical protein HK099_007629 [Clydaea vesicula]|uniref:Resolvase/invertase-type recombinase catalytic domain-containing protein n=1 Tax=Clydaea vesicula TaxID=447962 RepID=A0AAD5U111_9FUNG|nr:hypothetical protein HK099_007629 [Clydaea vesicula]